MKERREKEEDVRKREEKVPEDTGLLHVGKADCEVLVIKVGRLLVVAGNESIAL